MVEILENANGFLPVFARLVLNQQDRLNTIFHMQRFFYKEIPEKRIIEVSILEAIEKLKSQCKI